CTTSSDCPTYTCAGPASCITTAGGRRCTYAGLDDGACADSAPCTDDRCDPLNASDGTGCIHLPIAGVCDDGHSCTEDVCHVAPAVGDTTGCIPRPNDARCSWGSSLECATSLCVANEANAVFDPATGCGLAYAPLRCGAGEHCDASGQCEDNP